MKNILENMRLRSYICLLLGVFFLSSCSSDPAGKAMQELADKIEKQDAEGVKSFFATFIEFSKKHEIYAKDFTKASDFRIPILYYSLGEKADLAGFYSKNSTLPAFLLQPEILREAKISDAGNNINIACLSAEGKQTQCFGFLLDADKATLVVAARTADAAKAGVEDFITWQEQEGKKKQATEKHESNREKITACAESYIQKQLSVLKVDKVTAGILQKDKKLCAEVTVQVANTGKTEITDVYYALYVENEYGAAIWWHRPDFSQPVHKGNSQETFTLEFSNRSDVLVLQKVADGNYKIFARPEKFIQNGKESPYLEDIEPEIIVSSEGLCIYKGENISDAVPEEKLPHQIIAEAVEAEKERQQLALMKMREDAKGKANSIIGNILVDVEAGPAQPSGFGPEQLALRVMVTNKTDRLIRSPKIKLEILENEAVVKSSDVYTGYGFSLESGSSAEMIAKVSLPGANLLEGLTHGQYVVAGTIISVEVNDEVIYEDGSNFIPDNFK